MRQNLRSWDADPPPTFRPILELALKNFFTPFLIHFLFLLISTHNSSPSCGCPVAQREIKRTQPLALNIIIYAIADDDNDDDVDSDDEDDEEEEDEDEDGPRHSASSFMHRFSNTKEILNRWFSNV